MNDVALGQEPFFLIPGLNYSPMYQSNVEKASLLRLKAQLLPLLAVFLLQIHCYSHCNQKLH